MTGRTPNARLSRGQRPSPMATKSPRRRAGKQPARSLSSAVQMDSNLSLLNADDNLSSSSSSDDDAISMPTGAASSATSASLDDDDELDALTLSDDGYTMQVDTDIGVITLVNDETGVHVVELDDEIFCQAMPHLNLSMQLFDLFFTEKSNKDIVDRTSLIYKSEKLWNGMYISKRWAANFFLIWSIAAIIMPKHHELRQLCYPGYFEKNGPLWYQQACEAMQNIKPTPDSEVEEEEEAVQEVVFHALQAQRSLLLGDSDSCWNFIGQAIRKGVNAHMFKHEHCSSYKVSKRCRSQSALAQFIVHTDRWMCFNRRLPFGIASQYIRLINGPTATSEARILRDLEACHDYRLHYSKLCNDNPDTKYVVGQRLLDLIQADLVQSLAELNAPKDLLSKRKDVPLNDLLPSSMDSAARASVVQLMASYLYIQCFFGLDFMHDEHAPKALQRRCIDTADSLLRTIPVFLQIIEECKVVVPLERLATQIFCAARVHTDAIYGELLVVEEEEEQRGDRRPGKRSRQGSNPSSNSSRGAAAERRGVRRLEQVFAALETIEAQGSQRAGRMKRLLCEVMASVVWKDSRTPTFDDVDWDEEMFCQPPDAAFSCRTGRYDR